MNRLFAALILVLLTAPADAQDIHKSRAALERGDYAAALREWRPLAEQGDAVAQFNLGTMYQLGRGVRQNHAEAIKWYRLAAQRGHVVAQVSLGRMYDRGDGVP